MSAECCAFAAGERPGHSGRAKRRASLLALAATAALAIAVPKCPLCLAAQLAFLGVGLSAASAIAPWLLPCAIALGLLTLGLLRRTKLPGSAGLKRCL